ncbi:hypothetical protein NP493_206g01005 [Ridgeia piscesae]|uniref:Uncharacterized protein n=1 Tax=Ridgeia piscesae TaxID=27915 RepID=A0AAD9P1L7_RIDPI|nr:hypothetical protein NP493_206g01005 [Ridgeia piscesae]
MACIVLHNTAVWLRLPVTDEDDHPVDGNNEGCVRRSNCNRQSKAGQTGATIFQRVHTFSKSYYVINIFYLNYKGTFVELSSATVGTNTMTHFTG